MKRIFAGKSIVLALAVLLISTVWGTAGEQALVSFEIRDQFKNVHTDGELRGTILVTIGGNRGGKEYYEQWNRAIRDSLQVIVGGAQVKVLRVPDLRGVPFFVKGAVKGGFSKNPEEWALLDWKGVFAKAYDYTEGESNILVFDKEGNLAHQTHGTEVDPQKLNAIIGSLRSLLNE